MNEAAKVNSVKKPGWNPKKGIVEPKSKLASPGADKNQTDSALPAAASELYPAAADLPQTTSESEQAEVINLGEPKIYTRSVWKSGVHWVGFGICALFNAAVVLETLIYFASPHQQGMVWGQIRSMLFAYGITIFVDLMALPSLVCEAQRVELHQDCFIVQTLLYKCRIPWEHVRSVFDPMYLKFAVIRTPRFFQLINKRDIKHFDELLHIIKVKAGVHSN